MNVMSHWCCAKQPLFTAIYVVQQAKSRFTTGARVGAGDPIMGRRCFRLAEKK